MNHEVLQFSDAIAGVRLHFAVKQKPPESPYKLALSSSLRLLQRVFDGGRLALQVHSTTIAPPGTLEEALSSFCHELPPGMLFRIIVMGKSKPLEPAIQEQLYLIGREALVNALRHAKANRIEVEIEYLSRRLRMFVRDNGCGIDPQMIRVGRDGHWGLLGMCERAHCIGAQLRIRSRRGAGTEVEISIPGNVVTDIQARPI